MGRHERTEFYRNNRDYRNLLNGEDVEQEDEEEGLEESNDERRSQNREPMPPEEDPLSQECQEYYVRRQRLKELERQKLRRSMGHESNNGTNRKKLPNDNYGSFFGPSEPVVTRRIIEDARAREEAVSHAARMAKEAPERNVKVSSGSTRPSTSESRPMERVKQQKSVNETAIRAQRLKEARDFSFLFTDEDPTVPPKQPDGNSKKSGNEKSKPLPSQASKSAVTPQKAPPPMKSGSVGKPTKPTNSTTTKLSGSQQRLPPIVKEKLPTVKEKSSKFGVSSHSKVSLGRASHSNKLVSGPGRPPQGSNSASITNGKKTTAVAQSQIRKADPAGTAKSSLQATSGKLPPHMPGPSKVPVGRGGSTTLVHKSASAGSHVKKGPMVSQERKEHLPETSRPLVAGNRPLAGHGDQRRPGQVGATSRQGIKHVSKALDVRRVPKRPRDSESEDSFLDDDDEGGGDVSTLIRKMFGYNPNKYRELDNEDDRNMEANFRTIQQEEKRSARIAREEDDRELALIEEEERRERAKAKQRKLKHR